MAQRVKGGNARKEPMFSALPPNLDRCADMIALPRRATTGLMHRSKRRLLFDPFVDECADGRLDVEAERLGAFRLSIICYFDGAGRIRAVNGRGCLDLELYWLCC
jgi:hypothetical protein